MAVKAVRIDNLAVNFSACTRGKSEPTVRIELTTSCLRNSPDRLWAVPRRPSASGNVWVLDDLGRGGTAHNNRIGLLFGLRRSLEIGGAPLPSRRTVWEF